MKTLSSKEAQNNFGSVVDMVKAGEVVSMTQYGRPSIYWIPQNEDSRDALRIMAGRRASRLLANAPENLARSTLTDEEINELVYGV